MARKARVERTSRYVALARGVKKRWMLRDALVLDAKTYTPQEVLDALKALVDQNDASRKARAAWLAQVAKQRRLELAQRGFVAAIEVQVRLEYGKNPVPLSDFGLEPPKKTGPKTFEVKAAAAEKGRATRAERGTMGKRQRKKIKAG